MKTETLSSQRSFPVALLCLTTLLGLLAVGCGNKGSEEAATAASPAPAGSAAPGATAADGRPVPGNPNPNAAANAAAFEAARKKAEGK